MNSELSVFGNLDYSKTYNLFKRNSDFLMSFKRSVNPIKPTHLFQIKTYIRYKECKRANRIKSMFNDPGLEEQWYFTRTNRNSSKLSHNLEEVWNSEVTGKGVLVAIVDSGIEINHFDLKENFNAELSYDFLEDKKEITETSWHGTAMAGFIAAVPNNNFCGIGAAPDSRFCDLKIFGHLNSYIIEEVLVKAYSFRIVDIDIYSNSWGCSSIHPESMDGPTLREREAIIHATFYGRKGLGSLVLFGAGNSLNNDNNCAFNGYTQIERIFVISALTEDGEIPYYIQGCTAMVAATLSSKSEKLKDSLFTTFLNNDCIKSCGFTSASTAIAAGIFALLLQANKKLTPRQILYLITLTSTQYDKNHIINGAGYKYSENIGFGLLNASYLISASKSSILENFPEPHRCITINATENSKKQSNSSYESWIYTSGCYNFHNCVTKIEDVYLNFSLRVTSRNHVRVSITSPSGTKAHAIKPRQNDTSNMGFDYWIVKMLNFYGETALGAWKIEVINSHKDSTLKNWQLSIYGSCSNPDQNAIVHNKIRSFLCKKRRKIGIWMSLRLCLPKKKNKDNHFEDIYSFSKTDYKQIGQLNEIIKKD